MTRNGRPPRDHPEGGYHCVRKTGEAVGMRSLPLQGPRGYQGNDPGCRLRRHIWAGQPVPHVTGCYVVTFRVLQTDEVVAPSLAATLHFFG